MPAISYLRPFDSTGFYSRSVPGCSPPPGGPSPIWLSSGSPSAVPEFICEDVATGVPSGNVSSGGGGDREETGVSGASGMSVSRV